MIYLGLLLNLQPNNKTLNKNVGIFMCNSEAHKIKYGRHLGVTPSDKFRKS